MARRSLITQKMRKLIGVESDPSVYEVEKEAIRRWAEAVGDSNPIYHDEDAAKAEGHSSLPAPPGFVGNYLYPVKGPHPWSQNRDLFPNTVFIQTAIEYEIFEPAHAGDVLTERTKIVELVERVSKSGKRTVVFRTSENVFKNQRGDTVALMRYSGILYPNTKRR